jgi:hypothetical protein
MCRVPAWYVESIHIKSLVIHIVRFINCIHSFETGDKTT